MGAKADVDHRAIEELAEHYALKGRAVGRICVAVGAVVGVLVGSVPLTPLDFVWPIPSSYGLATVLVGLGVGLLTGFVIGDSRARMYHRMAEQARAQLVLEERISKSDLRIQQLVAALTARARAAAPAQQPQQQQQQQPVQEPAPPVFQPPVFQQAVQPAVAVPRPEPPVAEPVLPEPQVRVVAPPPPTLAVLPPVAAPAPVAEPAPEQQQHAAASGQGFPVPPPLSPPVSG